MKKRSTFTTNLNMKFLAVENSWLSKKMMNSARISTAVVVVLSLLTVSSCARPLCHSYCNLSPEGVAHQPERGVCILLESNDGSSYSPFECLCMPGYFGNNCTEPNGPVHYTEFINRKCLALNASLTHDPDPRTYATICGCNIGYGGATCSELCPAEMHDCNINRNAGYCVYNFRSSKDQQKNMNLYQLKNLNLYQQKNWDLNLYQQQNLNLHQQQNLNLYQQQNQNQNLNQQKQRFQCSCSVTHFGERCQIYVALGLLLLDYFYISIVFAGYVLLIVYAVLLAVHVIRVFLMATDPPHPRGNLYVGLSFASALLYLAAIGAKIANLVGFTYDLFTDKPLTFIVPIVFNQVSYGCFMSMIIMLFMKWTLAPGKSPSFFTSPSGRFIIIAVANIIVVIAVAVMIPLTIVTSRIGFTVFHFACYVIIMILFIGIYRMSFNAVASSRTHDREVFQLWLYLLSIAFTLVLVLYAIVRLMYMNALIVLLSAPIASFILLIIFAIVEAFAAVAELLLFVQFSSFIVDKQSLLKYTGGIVIHLIYQRITGKMLFLDETNEEVLPITEHIQ